MRCRARARRHSESGITMLELLFAGAVLVIGILGIMVLITAAIASNGRNRLDSTGTMLAEAVIEQVNSTVIGAGTANLTDCAGNTWTINTATGGANLSNSQIDFTQSQSGVPSQYYMNYVVCNGNSQATYDVRWNIRSLTSGTYLITVGAQLKGSSGNLRFYALPVNLRSYVGP